ncbi:putative pyrophosphatase [Geoglobus ahangari]|uniref:Putative pyrophosphatase n=1 Tax=Geoglobus ahangari TaxID=113653 RepID=A0A0F7II32_9EURY|nr:MazG nucleotide pyrophosphohydrolase domain-containing protein [Geoglobus ahangari]AKG91688.1 putative pyrophosphatase [Geoglobus ahangari]
MRISEFQNMIRELYFEKDERRGVERTFLWLVEEVGELAEAVRTGENAGEEFADVFAWLVSLANLCGVDLEEEVGRKYPGYCIRCGSKPCRCEEVV